MKENKTTFTQSDILNIETLSSEVSKKPPGNFASDETFNLMLEREISSRTACLEERLKDLEAAQALGHVGDFYYDFEKNSVRWSPELYRIMGYEIGEPLDFEKAISVYTGNERKKLEILTAESLETGKNFELETRFFPNGQTEERFLFLKAAPVFANGKGIGLKGVVQDITEHKQAEQKIGELNRQLMLKNRELESLNSELATFNNIAANDYSLTLRTLYTNLEYVLQNEAASFSNAGKANMRKAQMAIQKLKLLTEDIVAFSRIPDMDRRTDGIDLFEIMASVLNDSRAKIEESGLKVTVGELPSIAGFPLLISILFHHLTDNAAKFSDPNPTLDISAESETIEGKIFHKIAFKDNGIGIPAEESDNIFSIFHRLHDRQAYKGSGVGLAVCRKIMDLHQGFISVESKIGNGSTFNCYFPA